MACERHEYTLWQNVCLQAWGCLVQSFYDAIKVKYGWISYLVSCESHAVESGFIAQTKQNITFDGLWDIASQKPVIVDKLAIFHLMGAPWIALITYPVLKEDFDY